jgi:hypothetical protein
MPRTIEGERATVPHEKGAKGPFPCRALKTVRDMRKAGKSTAEIFAWARAA